MKAFRKLALVVARWVGIAWRCFSSTSVLGVLTVIATTMSAYAAFLSLQATHSATSVAEASQAFAQQIYSDQIAMGRPSISILSGETSVSEELENSYSSRTTKKYTASLILKNSGLRDTQRAWVALSSAGSKVSVATLPKDTEYNVPFDISWASISDLRRSSWYVAIVYEDKVPVEGPAPKYYSSSPVVQEPTPLRVVCSDVAVFKMTSWPKDPAHDPSIRTLSSGSPVAVTRMGTDKEGSNWGSEDDLARKSVVAAIKDARACLDKVF